MLLSKYLFVIVCLHLNVIECNCIWWVTQPNASVGLHFPWSDEPANPSHFLPSN